MARLIFAILLTAAFLYVIYPLLLPVIMGGVLAVLFWPLLERLRRRNVSPRLGSALLTLGITLLILIPSSLIVYFAVKAGLQQLQVMRDAPRVGGATFGQTLTSYPSVHHVLDWISRWFPLETEELAAASQDLAKSVGMRAADAMGNFFSHLPGMVMGLAVIVVSIYFFLVDGKRLVAFFRQNSFFTPSQTEQLLRTLYGVCRSVILASVVSGVCQAVFEFVMVVATGTPNAFLIAILCFLFSFVPLLGTAPITFGLALQQLLIGRTLAGVVLLVAAFVVAMMDNFIRPAFLRGTANLHPLLAFVAAFGGLQTLGFAGIFLGPILAAALVATLEIVLQGRAAAQAVARNPLS